MSDGAASATEGDAAERDERVLRLGAAGRGRAEIAAALGMSPEALAAREAEDAALAAALSAAAGLALAWWEAIAREACEAGRFSLAAWTREMRRRFGERGPPAGSKAGKPKPAPAPADWKPGEEPFPTQPRPGERAIFLLPCNGRAPTASVPAPPTTTTPTGRPGTSATTPNTPKTGQTLSSTTKTTTKTTWGTATWGTATWGTATWGTATCRTTTTMCWRTKHERRRLQGRAAR